MVCRTENGCDSATLSGEGYIQEGTITGGIYQDKPENYFFPQIQDLERETGNLVIFMQDGAPHFCQSVHKALNEKFPMPGLGGEDKSSGLPEVEILP
jgi:hypothetical protein